MLAPQAGRTPEQEAFTRAVYEKTQAAYAAIPPYNDNFSEEYLTTQIVPLIDWYLSAKLTKTYVVADVLRRELEERGVDIKSITTDGGFYICKFIETTEHRLKRLHPDYYKQWKRNKR